MANIKIIPGDLLTATEQYIAHQTNCSSRRAAGLAASLFRRFPHADVYRERTKPEPDKFGSIEVRGDGKSERLVIAIYGQIHPGTAHTFHSTSTRCDCDECRLSAFERGLAAVAAIPDLRSIAFPQGIGCGLAGGDWAQYLRLLENFAAGVPRAAVRIYRKELHG